MKRAPWLAICAIAALGGCDKPYDNGYAVDLIVRGDGTVTDAELQTTATLEFDVSGAETASTTYQLTRPFASGEERVIYRPLVAGGDLTFTVTARDSNLALIGAAVETVTLEPGKTVAHTVTLGKGGPDGMMSGTLVVERTSFNFGTYVSGQTATPHTFTVLNDSAMPSGAISTALTGVDVGAYAIEADTCDGKQLASGTTCTVAVRLKTATVGTPTANLVVSASPPGSAIVALSGTIVAPGVLTFEPTSGDFGSVAQGQSSAPLTFMVKNNSGAATGPLAVALSGDDGPLFGPASGCDGMTLGAGASCMVTVAFSPGTTALGARGATLVATADPGGTAAAELRGSAIKPGSIGITPGFYELGKVNVGQTSATRAYTITNTGTLATGPLSTMLSGNTDQFEVVSDGCQGQALAGGASCPINVRFRPTTAGTASLVLVVSGAPGGTVSATAAGTGGDFVTLTINKLGATGAVSAPGISCGADCTELYDRNTMVTITALPDLGTRFSMWGGAAPCAGTRSGVCTLTMDGDKSLDATFAARPMSNFVFVTSTTIVPQNLGAGGVDPQQAADAVCNNRALVGGLPGVYKAYLSTTKASAISRLGTASGWVRTDGQPVFLSLATLGQNKLMYPPRLDEMGTQLADDPMNTSGSGDVATGTDRTGALLAPNCTDWSAAGMYVFGYVAGASDTWVAINTMRDCAAPAHLYCFETSFTTGLSYTPPATFRRAFLTQGTYNPPSSGIGGADNVCNTEKTTYNVTVGGGGTFLAMLAPTGAAASSRFNIAAGSAPWVRPDGVMLAATAAGLFTDSLMAAPNVTANGTYVEAVGAQVPFVLIGAAAGITANGADNQNCSNWNSTSGGAYGGKVFFADKNWSIGDTTGCLNVGSSGNQNRFLCLEQ